MSAFILYRMLLSYNVYDSMQSYTFDGLNNLIVYILRVTYTKRSICKLYYHKVYSLAECRLLAKVLTIL
jgi:hypothetical protein